MNRLEIAALTEKELTCIERLVMLYLFWIHKRKTEFYCNVKKMAQILGYSYRHILRTLKSLERKGYIEVAQDSRGSVKLIKLKGGD